ncbi:Mut7-C RNAse domain-containing protein [Halarchaeum salinum]|uniref:Mut7-C RNAse domain-containing protein n=1 Tax=Halarchaeum salinum TaxID=489912 RepID=A0AAV3S5B3_9EURY
MAGPEDTPLLLDVMLGKLARLLRMCGYDAAYALDRGVEDDDRLREIAAREDRTLLTRDEELARRAPDSVLLRTRHVDDQLTELDERGFTLALPDEPVRCATCNGRLEEASGPHPEHVPDDAERVWRCVDCGQRYWKGSHWDDVATRLAGL